MSARDSDRRPSGLRREAAQGAARQSGGSEASASPNLLDDDGFIAVILLFLFTLPALLGGS